jgi:hypothetical protein
MRTTVKKLRFMSSWTKACLDGIVDTDSMGQPRLATVDARLFHNLGSKV